MSRLLPQRLFLCLALALLLVACQTTVERTNRAQLHTLRVSLPPICVASVQTFREAVARGSAENASAPALGIFPLLHSNRFLNTLSQSVESDAQTSEWVTLLSDLAIEIRASENRNLSSPWSDADLATLAECSRIFSTSAEYREERQALVGVVSQSDSPSEYRPSRQILGALPLLRPFIKPRILAEHASERSMFFEDENFARSSLYRPVENRSDAADIGEQMRMAYASNALRLPLLADAQLDVLFREHAPSLQVELLDANDKIGAPRWQAGKVEIDTESPDVYTLASMTRFEGRNLLQLNYVFWFPERKPTAVFDLYAGKVDSIIWRVTLDEAGGVLLYDSIHSCGCYHKYFVVADELTAKAQPTSKEPANIFFLDDDSLRGGVALRMTANEHFIVGIEAEAAPGEAGGGVEQHDYRLLSYSLLQNLVIDGSSRSLFDERGLIAGSERLERFTLWPTGILSVGAMRQWGTHATGFIQEQHFDDGKLFEYYFESAPDGPPR